MKQQLNEVKRMQQLAGIKESIQQGTFSLDELDEFLIDHTLANEDELIEALPGWTGEGNETYDILEVYNGLEDGYDLEEVYAVESREDGEANLARVQKLIPKDENEPEPEVFLVELFFSSYSDEVDWEAVSGNLMGTAGPGIGGNGYILPKKYYAALETMIEGGSIGKISKQAPQKHKNLNIKTNTNYKPPTNDAPLN